MVNNIVLCFDGTDNTFGTKSPSNILELYKILEKNSASQHCFYQPGIGIDIDLTPSSFYNASFYPIRSSIKSTVDSAIAFSIDYHVIEAYRYLIKIYQPNDKIFLFGFSRGSFIARILAGMIEKIGLLDNGLEGMVKTAWEIYKNWEQTGQPNDETDPKKCEYSLKLFKQTFCRYNVSIEFMGLFDSINSCGLFVDKLFPYTSNTSNVKHIRHAVSIHERRSKFKQNLFVPHTYLPHFLESDCPCDSIEQPPGIGIHSAMSEIALPDEDSVTRSHQVSISFSRKCSSDLLEVWFSGDHADVGGSWPYDDNGTKLSVPPLRWIISFALEYGVLFKESSVREFDIKFPSLQSSLAYQHDVLSFRGYSYPNYVSPYCSSIEEEPSIRPDSKYKDSDDEENMLTTYATINELQSPMFPDFLKYRESSNDVLCNNEKDVNKGHGDNSWISTFFWWILEIIPIGYLVENTQGRWRPLYWPNLGEKRNLPQNAKLHWSLIWRMKFTRDVNFDHLPKSYSFLQRVIDEDEKFGQAKIDLSKTIIIRLDEIVDTKLGVIKLDFEKLYSNAVLMKKRIKLDVDWKNPPNELESFSNLV